MGQRTMVLVVEDESRGLRWRMRVVKDKGGKCKDGGGQGQWWRMKMAVVDDNGR